MREAKLLVYGFLLAGLATACTLAPRDTGTAFMFALEPVKVTREGPAAETLVVAAPTSAPELDTYRIALKKDNQRWDYYASARWADFLPVVVQDDLTKTLSNTRLFKTVTTDESGLTGDRILKTEIQTFQAEYTTDSAAPVIRVHMTVRLVGRQESAPLASFTLDAERKASGNTLSAVQAAFAAAFSEAQRQLVEKLGK